MHFPSFGKRPANTLLYITEVKTFRIDTDSKGVMNSDAQVIDTACESTAQLPSALEQIMEQSQSLGRKVWILYVRLNSYLITLPSVQVDGVDEEILQQALQFEYEALTGNSLSNSRFAYHFIGARDEMSSYWLNSIATETLDAILEKLNAVSCKLGGLTHPGGLPQLLSGSEESSWLRIECWPTLIFAMSRNPETGYSLQIFNHDADGDWQQHIDHWMLEDAGQVERSEAMMNNQLEYIPPTDENYHLTLDGALIFWMGLWAQYLVGEETPAVPLISKQPAKNIELMYSIGGGLAALLICSVHALWSLYQTDELKLEIAQLGAIEKEVKTHRDQLNKNKDKLRELQQQISLVGDNIELVPTAVKGLQQRPAELLKHLAQQSHEDLVIDAITLNEQLIIISGVALQANLSNLLAGNIEPHLKKLGWKVNPPTKTSLSILSNGGPWSFELSIEDLGIEGFDNR